MVCRVWFRFQWSGRRRTTLLLLTLLCASLECKAGNSDSDRLAEGVRLEKAGSLQAALDVLKPLIQTDHSALSPGETGIAWNVLGSTHQDLEQFNEARRCYETAIRILRNMPEQRTQYASAINNLGSLELSLDQFRESKIMRMRALRVFKELGDHGGIARTWSNLAVIALANGNSKTAERDLSNAFKEAPLANNLSENDWAAMYSCKGDLERRRQAYSSSIVFYRQAIARWLHGYGEDYFQLGIEYALLAESLSQVGDQKAARSSLERALAIDEKIPPGKTSIRYVEAELLYGRLLRATGAEEEGSKLEFSAIVALTNLKNQ